MRTMTSRPALYSGRCNLVVGALIIGAVFFTILQTAPQSYFQGHPATVKIPRDILQNTVDSASKCPTAAELTVGVVPSILARWTASRHTECRRAVHLFRQLLELTPRAARVVLPTSMKAKLAGWLNNDPYLMKMVENQTVVYVMNKWTFEGSIFNLLRQKRPRKASKSLGIDDRQYVEQLVRDSAPVCDFCNYTKYTATDVFGRIESKLSYTSSNVFKLEAWHSLVIFRSHHPLVWKYDEFADTFHTAGAWFKRVHEVSPAHVYPMIFWDMLGHAGGSQVHPHFHPFAAADGYYGYFRKWQQAASQYQQASPGRNYFADFIEVHDRLGLSVKIGSAVALAHLTPRKDHEVIFLAPDLNEDFVKLAYFVIRGYIDDLGKYCFSFGIALPTLDGKTPGLPAIGRIISRGSVSSVNADVTSMETFGASLVDTDPFAVIKMLKNSIHKRMADTTTQAEPVHNPSTQRNNTQTKTEQKT